MAAILGVTVGRLRQLAADGMPKEGRDLYPLSGCVQWYVQFWKSRAIKAGGTNGSRDRVENARATMMEAKAAQATGHLISKVEVAQAAEGAFMQLGKAFETLPSTLGRECNLPPDAIRKLRAHLDQFRRNFARDLGEYMDGASAPAEVAGARPGK